MNTARAADYVAKQLGISFDEVFDNGKFFRTQKEVFDFIFSGEYESVNDAYQLIQKMNDITPEQLEGFVNVADYLLSNHEGIYIFEDGYLYFK